MPDRFSSLAFWAVFVVIVGAVGYPTYASLRDDKPAAAPSPAPIAARPSPIGAPGLQPQPAAAVSSRSATISHARPAAAVARLAAGLPPAPKPGRWIPDSSFAFSGRWEHVRQLFDGRPNGSSSRSFHPGATATLRFFGRSLRLYGVVGPRGGLGSVTIDGRLQALVPFYAPVKSVHKLVYSSPLLERGNHSVTISVLADPRLRAVRSRYVNIGGANV